MELDTFNECVQEAIQENREQGKRRIAKFEETHLLVGSAPPVSPPCFLLQMLTPPRGPGPTGGAAHPLPLMTPKTRGHCPHLPEITQPSGRAKV